MLICGIVFNFIIIELYIVLFYFIIHNMTDFFIVDRYFLLYLKLLLLLFLLLLLLLLLYLCYFYFSVIFVFTAIPVK